MFPPKSRGLIIATLADFVKSEPTKINSRRDAEIFYILILCVFAPLRELILASVNPRDSLTVSPTLSTHRFIGKLLAITQKTVNESKFL